MKTDNQLKQEQIVEAALRRFSHFGIAKTAFTEIADDLGVSKQVLNYYFHDKQSLVRAVIEKLSTEYSTRLKIEMEAAPSTESGLSKLTFVKAVYFEKYFMMLSHADHLDIIMNETKSNWGAFLANKETGLLVKLFEKGVQTGELKPLDAPKTAQLLLETLYAFSRCVHDKGPLPDEAAFKTIMQKQQEVISLFYQGLKSETWAS